MDIRPEPDPPEPPVLELSLSVVPEVFPPCFPASTGSTLPCANSVGWKSELNDKVEAAIYIYEKVPQGGSGRLREAHTASSDPLVWSSVLLQPIVLCSRLVENFEG